MEFSSLNDMVAFCLYDKKCRVKAYKVQNYFFRCTKCSYPGEPLKAFESKRNYTKQTDA